MLLWRHGENSNIFGEGEILLIGFVLPVPWKEAYKEGDIKPWSDLRT